MRKSVSILRMVVVAAFLAAAGGGFALQGWLGVLVFLLAIVVAAAGLAVTWSIAAHFLTYQRHTTRMSNLRARVARLSTDQLRAIAASAGHPYFAFALVALARRGIETKPEKRLLLEMLVSADSGTRGLGMSYLGAFYPEVLLPLGSSSQDPPEVWRERLAAIAAWEVP